MKTKLLIQSLILSVFVLGTLHADTGKEIIDTSGVKGGLVVQVGCSGKLTAALQKKDSYLVHGLDTDNKNIEKSREYIRRVGLYGKVSVDTFDGKDLPYTDNLVNLLVVSKTYQISKAEMLRVLAPRGVAYVRNNSKWTKITKPWPSNIDEWTHYLHDSSNNAVAHDTQVGPPLHMQWLAGPRWTRNHHKLNSISSVVTSNGRIFYIVDEATAANMKVPGKWALVARNAFSGVQLWKKRLKSWGWYGRHFRSGPPQVTRLLVASASEDRLYAPLGLSSAVSQMDAVTGETLKTYDDTADAEELILTDGILLVLKGEPVAEQAVRHPTFRGKFKFPNKKSVVAIDTASGDKLWEWSEPGLNPMPETLCVFRGKVFFQVDESVICLDLNSGEKLWTYGKQGKQRDRRKITFGKYTLVAADGVVLCKLSGKLTALSVKNGKKLWECKSGGGFHSPLDIFVIDGLVWQGLHVKDSVAPPPVNDFDKGRDLHTGKVKKMNSIMVDLQSSGHHHRCYREKATDKYIITGKRGIEMMDLKGDNHSRNNWIRGTCQYGILPANGLIYAPPHSCGCYMESKLWGFWALAADRSAVSDTKRKIPDDKRLEKGPAYRQPETTAKPDSAESWTMYRHDVLRSGIAGTDVSGKLKQAWKIDIGGRLTQPVVGGSKVLLSAVDEHTIYSLDEKNGKVVWKFTAGGRVDSPPAIYKGLVLFGCADGCVYCLRLSDGKLVWRFRAASADIRAVAFNQVESLWPVHGSVLILDGVAYCSAGRSTWIDGGIDLYGLDPVTGKIVCKSHFQSKHPEFKAGKEKKRKEYKTEIDQNTTDYKTFLQSDRSDAFSMAGGAISDVLVSDGENVFLHHVKFNKNLEKQEEMSRHLFSTSSLLDDTENHRSHWLLGTGDFSRLPVAYSWIVNRPGGRRRNTATAVPYGLMMVYDDSAIWGIHRKGQANGEYVLFKRQNKPLSESKKSLPDFRKLPKDAQLFPYVWNHDLKIRPRALLKSGDKLFIGIIMPTNIPGNDPYGAYEGRKGGMIWIVSTKDGNKISEYKLVSPAVWDGMAAANGRLYISTTDGKLLCLCGQ